MTPKALEVLTGVDIDRIEIFVDHIESGSLLQEMLVRFFFKDEQTMMSFIDKARDKVGDGPVKWGLLGVVVGGIIYYGAQTASDSQGGDTTNITANNNVIINIGAGEVGMTPDAFTAIVRSAVGDRKELVKATQKVMKPARNDPDASITFDDSDVLVVPAAVVKEIPIDVAVGLDVREENFPSAELYIRATNRDSLNSGWVVRLPQKFGHRKLKMKLDGGIDPEQIAGKDKILADVTIHYRRSESSKKYLPDFIELIRVID